MLTNPNQALVWRRSQRCENGECVEVAEIAAGVALRDSTRPDGVLQFSTSDWATFLNCLRDKTGYTR